MWNKKDKKPGEKWIAIYVYPYAIGDFLPKDIDNLTQELRTAGYRPLVGMFGVGGPYSTGFAGLGSDGANASLYYFSKKSETMTAEVRENILRNLSITSLDVSYIDSSNIDSRELRRFIIENSELDLQLVLQPRSKK